MWKETIAPDGRKYYYDTVTQQTTWEKPDDFDAQSNGAQQSPQAAPAGAWREAKNAEGRSYYYNATTGVTTWEKPAGFQDQQPTIQNTDQRIERRDRYEAPARSSGNGTNSGPWEASRETSGFRGAQPTKLDEPDYQTEELAEAAFFKFLRAHGVKHDTAWEDVVRGVAREKGYRAIKDAGDRKAAFDKFCIEEKRLEQEKETQRKDKLRADFMKMLRSHEEIAHYTRYKNAVPMLGREVVFRNAGNDEERRALFREYVIDLHKSHKKEEDEKREQALSQLPTLIAKLVVDPATRYADALERLEKDEVFNKNSYFRSLSKLDILKSIESHIKNLWMQYDGARQRSKLFDSMPTRQRQLRDEYKQLLREHLKAGNIRAGSRMREFYPLIAQDSRFRNLLVARGSTALELFYDVVAEQEAKADQSLDDVLDVLEEQRYELDLETPLAEFENVMSRDKRTQHLQALDLKYLFNRLMQKVRNRRREEEAAAKRALADAVDDLRSAIRHLDSPVRIDDKYEDVVPKIQHLAEFQALDDEHRRVAYDKHMRRLKDKKSGGRDRGRDRDYDRDLEPDRASYGRERDRDQRNGRRRSYDEDRSRHRTHRTRSPEFDAYEADRLRAQANRERQYRAHRGQDSPPLRERRDDRRDDHRGGRRDDRRDDRRDGRYERRRSSNHDDVYDRERREREAQREQSYISRADPRDKGKNSTLDYGDDDLPTPISEPARKRRESEVSVGSKRESKRARRHTRDIDTAVPMELDKAENKAVQSGSEEGEIEEV